MTTLLIDGDILAYAAAFAIEKAVSWDEDGDLWTTHWYPEEGREIIDEKINAYMEELDADKAVVALSDSENWRKEIFPAYKENRKGQRKPFGLKQMRQYMQEACTTFIRPGLEADDVLGILMTKDNILKDKDRIIVSIDKDFKTIPGKICILKDGEDMSVQTISKEDADYFHLFQTLTGDSSDGYAGVPESARKRQRKFWPTGRTGQKL